MEQLFATPGIVIQYLWQALSLAIGITLAPLFIKLLLDGWLGSPAHQTDDRKKVAFLACTASLLMVTMVSLGHFRALSYQESIASTARSRMAALAGVLSTFGAARSQAADPQASGQLPQWLTTVTFVLLTITIPLIGSIFFTAGWGRLSGSFRRVLSQLSTSHIEWRHLRLVRQAAGLQQEILDKESVQLPRLQSPEYLHSQVQSRLSLYEHGYERGRRVAVTLRHGDGVYERSRFALLRRMAEREWRHGANS
jgi:hypothetical protein